MTDHALAPAGRIKSPVWLFVSGSYWHGSSSHQKWLKGSKMCCISNGMDGTDDDVLWNDSEEDGIVRSECEEGEATDCEDGDSDTV